MQLSILSAAFARVIAAAATRSATSPLVLLCLLQPLLVLTPDCRGRDSRRCDEGSPNQDDRHTRSQGSNNRHSRHDSRSDPHEVRPQLVARIGESFPRLSLGAGHPGVFVRDPDALEEQHGEVLAILGLELVGCGKAGLPDVFRFPADVEVGPPRRSDFDPLKLGVYWHTLGFPLLNCEDPLYERYSSLEVRCSD